MVRGQGGWTHRAPTADRKQPSRQGGRPGKQREPSGLGSPSRPLPANPYLVWTSGAVIQTPERMSRKLKVGKTGMYPVCTCISRNQYPSGGPNGKRGGQSNLKESQQVVHPESLPQQACDMRRTPNPSRYPARTWEGLPTWWGSPLTPEQRLTVGAQRSGVKDSDIGMGVFHSDKNLGESVLTGTPRTRPWQDSFSLREHSRGHHFIIGST